MSEVLYRLRWAWWFVRTWPTRLKVRRWARRTEATLHRLDPELARLFRSCPLDATTPEGLEKRLWMMDQVITKLDGPNV